ETSQPLPGAGDQRAEGEGPPTMLREGGEGGDEDQTTDAPRVACRQRLGDRPAHRVADHVGGADPDPVQDGGALVGADLDVVPGGGQWGQAVAPVVDEDQPATLRQSRADAVPLAERRPAEPVNQHDRGCVHRAGLANEELLVADEHGATLESPRVLLRRAEPRLIGRCEQPPGEKGPEGPAQPLHLSSPRVKIRSSTGLPPTRCSSMTRSSFSLSRLAYQVPSG